MKSSYIIGALATVLVGMTGVWGMNEYLSLKTHLKEVQKGTQPTSSSSIITPFPSPQAGTPASPVLPTPSPNLAQTAPTSFEALPLCDQLDSIAKSGKVVSDFIAKSGRYEGFVAEVNAKCNWHAEQLKQADRILHPPVAYDTPVEGESALDPVYTPVVSEDVPKPRRTPWNNCNALQEPGESFSAECKAKQDQTDKTGITTPGDNRPPYRRDKDSIYKGCCYDCGDYSACYDSSDEDASTTGRKYSQPKKNEMDDQPSGSRSERLDNSVNRSWESDTEQLGNDNSP